MAGRDELPPDDVLDSALRDYYEARAPEYDDWYLRRRGYSRGPVSDVAWHMELDEATLWLDRLPLSGEIVELAAGTGWWSPLLANKGELSIYDTSPAALDRARSKLLAHHQRVHIHERDAWADPERPVDALFTGFWLTHVPRRRLPQFLALALRWLKPGGTYAFVDSTADPGANASNEAALATPEGIVTRHVTDGREFRIARSFHTPDHLRSALEATGFRSVEITQTARYFLLGRASR